MSIFKLAWRSVKQRPLASILTMISVALGVALTIAIVSLRDSAHRSYHETSRGYDAILGPTHGSPLQIVLNTMFHVGDAGGTLPWATYERAKNDKRVKYAVPYAVGDYFRGKPVVGTSTAMFEALMDPENVPLGKNINGVVFRDGVHFEAVAGSIAAAETGLRRGVKFKVTHGPEGGWEHGEEWTVVGILRPTGTPADRAIFIPIETFYEVGDHKTAGDQRKKRREEREAEEEREREHGHEHGADTHTHEDDHGHEHGTKEELGLSAVGIRLKSPILRLAYVAEFKSDRATVQAVMPADQVRQLFEVVGSVDRFFELTAWLIVLVAGIGILVSLYNTIQGRRREIAILRAMGATPRHVFAVIVLESVILVVLGGLFGLVLGHAGLAMSAPYLVERFGVLVRSGFGTLDLQVMGALAVFGLVVGLLPAWRGLRTPVAENLHPTE